MKDVKCCAAMRHETSLNAVFGFVSGLGGDVSGFRAIVMDRAAQAPDVFEQARGELMASVRGGAADVYVLASKINDTKEGSGLAVLLADMKREGLGDRPVIVTFLEKLGEDWKKALQNTGVALHIVEQDNLGYPKAKDGPEVRRTGMSQCGPVLLAVCGK